MEDLLFFLALVPVGCSYGRGSVGSIFNWKLRSEGEIEWLKIYVHIEYRVK